MQPCENDLYCLLHNWFSVYRIVHNEMRYISMKYIIQNDNPFPVMHKKSLNSVCRAINSDMFEIDFWLKTLSCLVMSCF